MQSFARPDARALDLASNSEGRKWVARVSLCDLGRDWDWGDICQPYGAEDCGQGSILTGHQRQERAGPQVKGGELKC